MTEPRARAGFQIDYWISRAAWSTKRLTRERHLVIAGSSSTTVLRPDYAASAAKARLMAFKKKIIEFFSPFLGKSQSASPGNLIAAYTVARCNDLDSRLRVQRLVPTDGADGETRNHGPQESIVANLFEAIAYDTGDTRFRTFVLTGEAGVGKSTALRAISRKLAIAFQDGSVPLDLLPITLPSSTGPGAAIFFSLFFAGGGGRAAPPFAGLLFFRVPRFGGGK